MKKYVNLSLYAILLVAVLAFTSCQKEEPFETDIDQEKTLTVSAAAVELIKQTVSNDGSYDNIVDGASCFDIRFPYMVSVNGLELTIDSMEDLQTIEEILDIADDNEDIMEIVFPITITMADYTEITINGVQDLREIAEQCIEGGDDDDIECIDIVYPVTVFTYNPNFQQTAAVTVEHDMELRRFFAGLQDTDLISFDFPVSFEHLDGTKVTVNSNSELADAIERAKKACDEDDDNDHNDDDFTKERLDSLLVKCPWTMEKFEGMTVSGADHDGDYVLTFGEDGKISADNRYGHSIQGEWSTIISDFRLVLEMEFTDASGLDATWHVYEIEEGTIVLFTGDDKIVLESNCDYEPQECSETYIKEILSVCKWIPAQQDNDFLDYLRIDFSNTNIHVRNPNGTLVDEGNWEISGNKLTFHDLSMEMANYIGEWTVTECSADRFKLLRGDETLVIEKDCKEESVACSEDFIKENLGNCQWKISNEDGTFFEDLNIDFSNMNIHAYDANNNVVDEGNWQIAGTTVTFNDLSMTLANYIGEWEVIECNETRFKLKRNEEVIVVGKYCD